MDSERHKRFEEYDWASDAAWQQTLTNLYIPPGRDTTSIIQKKKLKFYQRHVDPGYEPETSQQTDSSTSDAKSSGASTTDDTDDASTAGQSTTGSPPNAAPQFTARSLSRKTAITLAYVQLVAHLLVVVHAVFVILPFLPFVGARTAFYRALKFYLLGQTLQLVQTHGIPQFNAVYAQRAMLDEETHFMLFALFMHLSEYSVLVLAPCLVRSGLFVARALLQVLPMYAPQAVQNMLLPHCQKAASMSQQAYDFGADMELYVFFYNIILLFTPSRNILLLVTLLQYLRLRYAISHSSRRVWSTMRYKLDTLLLAPGSRAPGIIQSLYSKIKGLLSKYGDPAAAAQSSSSCSIM